MTRAPALSFIIIICSSTRQKYWGFSGGIQRRKWSTELVQGDQRKPLPCGHLLGAFPGLWGAFPPKACPCPYTHLPRPHVCSFHGKQGKPGPRVQGASVQTAEAAASMCPHRSLSPRPHPLPPAEPSTATPRPAHKFCLLL